MLDTVAVREICLARGTTLWDTGVSCTLLPVDGVNSSVQNERCSRVLELFSFFLTMESFAHQISCRTWPLKAQKVRGSRSALISVFFDPNLFQILRYMHKLYTSSSRHVISSRRPCCRTSLRGTNVSSTKRKKKQKFMAFQLRKSFDRLVKPRRHTLNEKRTRRKKLVRWVTIHARCTGEMTN